MILYLSLSAGTVQQQTTTARHVHHPLLTALLLRDTTLDSLHSCGAFPPPRSNTPRASPIPNDTLAVTLFSYLLNSLHSIMNGNEILRAGRRFVQYVWDPESKNEDDSPIWCLGQRYDSHPVPTKSDASLNRPSAGQTPPSYPESIHSQVDSGISSTSLDTKPPQLRSLSTEDESFEKVEAQDEGLDNGWPPAFLDDVESKLWLTYRSDFPEIPQSTDPQAMTSMSFSQRLKMMANKGGFSSDTGWGCMIRSGQSLLANTLLMLELGRGIAHPFSFHHSSYNTTNPSSTRLAQGPEPRSRSKTSFPLRRPSFCSILHPPFRRPWCFGLWQTSW